LVGVTRKAKARPEQDEEKQQIQSKKRRHAQDDRPHSVNQLPRRGEKQCGQDCQIQKEDVRIITFLDAHARLRSPRHDDVRIRADCNAQG
jgi:hypothetical protein